MGKLVALVVIALVTSFILFGHRLIVNRTHSLPVGLYYWSDVPIKKGSIVLFKPDQSTPLQQLGINRGYEVRKLPLLKRVVAFWATWFQFLLLVCQLMDNFCPTVHRSLTMKPAGH